MRVQAISLEGGLPEPEMAATRTLRQRPAEALFDDSLHGRLLSLCQLPQLFVKTIWYLYGCLHTGNHIVMYWSMSSFGLIPGFESRASHFSLDVVLR
jgi:hypothetical protein